MLRALPIFPPADSVWLEMADFRENGDFFPETIRDFKVSSKIQNHLSKYLSGGGAIMKGTIWVVGLGVLGFVNSEVANEVFAVTLKNLLDLVEGL